MDLLTTLLEASCKIVAASTTILMLAGTGHTADKIALICSDAKGKDD